MKQHDYDKYSSFSALLDKGAEVFTKKKSRHSQSKAQEHWNDTEQSRRGKKTFALRTKSHRDGFDLG